MQPVVSPAWLAAHLGDPDLRIADVRWALGKPGAGRAAWMTSRIPGAVFLDIDTDLAHITAPRRGRHPLPEPARLAATLAAHGIGGGARVVAYDDAGGTHAARLWWLLGGFGIDAAVLDGGFPAWFAAGFPVENQPPSQPSATAAAVPATAWNPARSVDKSWVSALIDARPGAPCAAAGVPILVDARAPERYRGETEPIDPRPGHIPTAIN